MQRCILPSSARAVSKQLILPNGRGLVRVPRRVRADLFHVFITLKCIDWCIQAFADAAVVPRRSVAKSLRRIVFFSTLATGTFYAGSALVSFNSQAYHDFFVENVPLGAAVVQFAEDHDWDDLDLDSVTEGVVAVGGAVGAVVSRVTSLVSPPKEETKVEKVANKTRDAKDITLAKGAEAKDAALATGKDAKDVVSRKATDARTATTSTAHSVKDTAIETKDAMVAKAKAAKDSVKAAVAPVTDKVKAAANSMVTTVVKSEEKVSAVTRSQVSQFGSEIDRLINDAEHVLSGKPISDLINAAEGAVKDAADNVADHVATPEKVQDEAKGNIYNVPLPLGFEPPPGFSRPAPPPKPKTSSAKADGKVETPPAPPPLPLLAPAVAALGASEPVISQLAGTIDTLASYLNAVPTASTAARDALSTAQVDLEALAGRVESVRAGAQQKLETSLEAQASEYNGKVLQVEMEAQDRLDQQEDGFRKILAEEREELVKKYREKLMKELEVQSEIIDQRLVHSFDKENTGS
jgi:mitofilin